MFWSSHKPAAGYKRLSVIINLYVKMKKVLHFYKTAGRTAPIGKCDSLKIHEKMLIFKEKPFSKQNIINK